MLVKGVTPSLLYGTDRNRNGQLDPGEDDGSGYSAGWAAYITVYGREPNVDSQGNPRINLNGNDLTSLQSDLTNAVGSDLATFLLGYRLFGTGSTGATQLQGNAGGLSITISLTRAGTMAELQQKVQAAIASNTQPRQRISSLFALVSRDDYGRPHAADRQPADAQGRQWRRQHRMDWHRRSSVSFASPLADKSTQVDFARQVARLDHDAARD